MNRHQQKKILHGGNTGGRRKRTGVAGLKKSSPLLRALCIVLVAMMVLPGMLKTAAADVTSLLGGFTSFITQNGTELADNAEIDVTKPFKINAQFSIPVKGDDPDLDPAFYVNKGDTAEFKLVNLEDFNFVGGATTVEMTTPGGTRVGTVVFSQDHFDNSIIATVYFDGDDTVFDGTYYNARAGFEIELDYDGTTVPSPGGSITIAILDKTYTITPPVEPSSEVYGITKSGALSSDQKSVTWTAVITASGSDATLEGKVFKDTLTLPPGAAYKPGSLTVDGAVMADPATLPDIAVTLPAGTVSPATITFVTEIDPAVWQSATSLTLPNSAGLYKGDGVELIIDVIAQPIIITPTWISKSGALEGTVLSDGYYNPQDGTIKWTISGNAIKADLGTVVLRDVFPNALGADYTIVSVKDKNTDTSKTFTDTFVAGDPNNTITITLPSVDYEFEIVISMNLAGTGLPENDVAVMNYTNTVYMDWSADTKSASATVGIGVGGIVKTANDSDITEGIVSWTNTVYTHALKSGQTATVYDLIIYGNDVPAWASIKDSATAAGLPETIYNAISRISTSAGVAPARNQQYSAGSLSFAPSLPGSAAANVYTLYDNASGEAVADLIVIDNIPRSNTPFSFTYQTKVDSNAAPEGTKLDNTAYILTSSNHWGSSTASITTPSSILSKQALAAGSQSVADLEDGLYPTGWTAASSENIFDDTDMSAVFAITVNSSKYHYTELGKSTTGPAITVADTLPDGWDVMPFASTGEYYAIFDATTGTPVIPPPTVARVDNTVSFAFTAEQLDANTIVIFIKAGPTAETKLEYFGSNGTYFPANKAKLYIPAWSFESGESSQEVKIESKLISKSNPSGMGTGILHWTVTYDPKGLAGLGDYLTDTLSDGLEFPLNDKGELIADDFKVSENGIPLTGDLSGLFEYDTFTKTLTFKFPHPENKYVIEYDTYVTGPVGDTEKNKVILYKVDGSLEIDPVGYKVSSADAWAIAYLSGWFSLTKVDENTGQAIKNNPAVFTLFAEDGKTPLRHGETDADGVLAMYALHEGKYYLVETEAPAGYEMSAKSYEVVVKSNGSEIITSIDGMTGLAPNRFIVDNHLNDSVGHVKISKAVTGGGGDRQKKFSFTVYLYDTADNQLTGTYYYRTTKSGIVSTAFESGQIIELAHGEDAVLRNLPVGTKCVVVENAGDHTASYVVSVDADVLASGNGNEAEGLVPNDTVSFDFTNYKGSGGGGDIVGGGGDDDSDADADTDSDADTDTDMDNDNDMDTDTDMDADADTDSDSDADSDSDNLNELPVPTTDGHTLVEDVDGWIELGVDGVPHGRWTYDPDTDMWLFDPFMPLAGVLPQTGLAGEQIQMLVLVGLYLTTAGVILMTRKRKSGKHEE